MQNEHTFWLVWNDGGYAPTHKHETLDSAVAEAQRLARAHRSRRFVVMEARTAFEVSDLQCIAYSENLPF